jgi:hypothetical protein
MSGARLEVIKRSRLWYWSCHADERAARAGRLGALHGLQQEGGAVEDAQAHEEPECEADRFTGTPKGADVAPRTHADENPYDDHQGTQ